MRRIDRERPTGGSEDNADDSINETKDCRSSSSIELGPVDLLHIELGDAIMCARQKDLVTLNPNSSRPGISKDQAIDNENGLYLTDPSGVGEHYRGEILDDLSLRNQSFNETDAENQDEINLHGGEIVTAIRDYTYVIDINMPLEDLNRSLEVLEYFIKSNFETLKKHTFYEEYVQNLIDDKNRDPNLRFGILNCIDSLRKARRPYTQKHKLYLEKIKAHSKALHSRIHPTGTGFKAIQMASNGSKNPAPLVQPVYLTLHPEEERRMQVISDLAGKEGRDMDDNLIAEVLKFNDSRSAFENILSEGERNFTIETEMPSVIMRDVIGVLKTDDRFKEYRENKTRMLEYGPGKGNEAVQFLLNFENIVGYHAIEGGMKAKEELDLRLHLLRERNRVRQKFESNIVASDYLSWFKMVPYTSEHYNGFPQGQFLIQFCESGMHYFTEDVFRKKMIKKMHLIAWAGTGIIVMALKTPNSDTFKDHIVIKGGGISTTPGYYFAQHKTQKDRSGNLLKRALIKRNAQLLIFDEEGFDILERTKGGDVIRDGRGDLVVNERAYVKTIPFTGYEEDGKTEEFVVIIARPKGMRSSY